MDPRLERRQNKRQEAVRRRRAAAAGAIVVVLAVAAWVVVPAIGSSANDDSSAKMGAASAAAAPAAVPAKPAPKPAGPPPQQIKPLVPGTAKVITEVPAAGNKVALTFDDGACSSCVKQIVDFLEKSGAHATFFPNGTYGASWDPQAKRIRALVENGQLTLGNHTFSHGTSTQIGSAAFGADLQRNEDWIQKTFNLSGRPWFRPPYGDYDSGTIAAAGQAGYKRVIMWSGTVADSDLRSEPYILNAIRYWAKPGRIILMHANYPPTAKALPKILKILERKQLQPVTVAELLNGA
ncbi:unannotated protein [freshwater metagenome]|uniref:Unannotated protein n=1 Tax=freshwater metagenome TaxID=449393 RepID=A0A6J5ZBT4_9ZZZZ|nr:polysaccharide deacetylase family protein [Actinomycetota bacterium]